MTRSFGADLAAVARRNAHGREHYCYQNVKDDLRAAGVSIAALQGSEYRSAAYQFTAWAKKNPTALAKMGFAAAGSSYRSAPVGSIVVWPKTVTGSRSNYGHIEIAVGGGVGCSNFCAKMAPTVGEVPTVYVPIACTSRGGDDERE